MSFSLYITEPNETNRHLSLYACTNENEYGGAFNVFKFKYQFDRHGAPNEMNLPCSSQQLNRQLSSGQRESTVVFGYMCSNIANYSQDEALIDPFALIRLRIRFSHAHIAQMRSKQRGTIQEPTRPWQRRGRAQAANSTCMHARDNDCLFCRAPVIYFPFR